MLEKYLVIYPSGLMQWVELERKPRYDGIYNGEPALCLSDIREVIGCDWLEQVRTIFPGIVMMVDEVGKVLPQPKAHNELASRLYGGWVPEKHDDICGTAVLFGLRRTGVYGELDIFPLLPSQVQIIATQMRVPVPQP